MSMRKWTRLAPLFALLLLLGLGVVGNVPRAHAQTGGPANVNVPEQSAIIRDRLQQAMRAYRLGDYEAAYKEARGAYLDNFENIEIPLRALNPDLTADMEFRFAKLRSAMDDHQPIGEVEGLARNVREGLDEIESMFSGGPGLV